MYDNLQNYGTVWYNVWQERNDNWNIVRNGIRKLICSLQVYDVWYYKVIVLLLLLLLLLLPFYGCIVLYLYSFDTTIWSQRNGTGTMEAENWLILYAHSVHIICLKQAMMIWRTGARSGWCCDLSYGTVWYNVWQERNDNWNIVRNGIRKLICGLQVYDVWYYKVIVLLLLLLPFYGCIVLYLYSFDTTIWSERNGMGTMEAENWLILYAHSVHIICLKQAMVIWQTGAQSGWCGDLTGRGRLSGRQSAVVWHSNLTVGSYQSRL